VITENVKASKRSVGLALPNNLLTAINKKSCLLDDGKCDSSHIEGGSKQRRQLIKAVGLELIALRLCGHWIESRLGDEIQRLQDSQELPKPVRIPQTQKISGLRK
jgi:hypothetical protein